MREASLDPDEGAAAGEGDASRDRARAPRRVTAPPRHTAGPPRERPAADGDAGPPAAGPGRGRPVGPTGAPPSAASPARDLGPDAAADAVPDAAFFPAQPSAPPTLTAFGLPVPRELLWALAVAACYALTLSISSESLVLLAFPGFLGLIFLEVVAVKYVLRRPGRRGAEAPYATDGSDRKSPVTYLYAALLRRYVLLVIASLAVMAVPLVTRAAALFPLMGAGLIGLILATVFWFDQLRWVRQCARVLNVYDFEFRAPVYQLDLWRNGRRFLVLGYEGLQSPEMSAREPMGHPRWPDRIASGVWFAGDEVFGGALLVPGTGELMCLQPLDWDEFAQWREAADDGRKAKAKRAGLDRHSV